MYKPQKGERPLWDFPRGTLCHPRGRGLRDLRSARVGSSSPTRCCATGRPASAACSGSSSTTPTITTSRCWSTTATSSGAWPLFDIVINNTDRKGGHCLLAKDGRVFGIDHGVSFHAQWKVRTVIWDFGGEPIPAVQCADLHRFHEQLDSRALGSPGSDRCSTASSSTRCRAASIASCGTACCPKPTTATTAIPGRWCKRIRDSARGTTRAAACPTMSSATFPAATSTTSSAGKPTTSRTRSATARRTSSWTSTSRASATTTIDSRPRRPPRPERDDVAGAHAVDVGDRAFDVLRMHVATAEDDDVLDAAAHDELAVDDVAEVTGAQPAVVERGGGRVGPPVVARRDRRARDLDLADLAVAHHAARSRGRTPARTVRAPAARGARAGARPGARVRPRRRTSRSRARVRRSRRRRGPTRARGT